MGPPKTRSAQTDSAVLSSAQSAIIPTTRGPASTMPVSKQPPTEIETGDTVHSSGAAILAAIAECKTALTSKIDFVATDVSLIRQDLDKFRMRITEVEDRISGVEDQVRSDSRDLKALQLQVCALQNRAIDTENRLRRNNIRIIGLPERAEGSCPTAFTEKLLIDLFGLTDLPPTFVIERAHRVPPAPPRPGTPPRPFLLRFLNYRDRDRILAAARSKPDTMYEDKKLFFFLIIPRKYNKGVNPLQRLAGG